ncbi:MAG: phage minor head protein [Bryobacteraceae bacterium]
MAQADYSMDFDADPAVFTEAVEEFAARRVITREEADTLEAYARRRAWWISGVAQMDVANDAFESILTALTDGVKFDDWKKTAGKAIEAEWGRTDSPRLLLIFRNATSQAYNAGRWDQMHHPAVAPLRPYVAYDVVWDSRTSKICRPLKDVVLPADDPFVLTHFPQLHHGCRTGLRSLRESVARRLGITTKLPDVDVTDGFGYPPNLTTPPLPSERANPPDPDLQLMAAVKGGKYLRESDPVVIPDKAVGPVSHTIHTPFGETKARLTDTGEFKRFTGDPDPISHWGHAMFVRDDAILDDQMGVYGHNKFLIKSGVKIANPDDLRGILDKLTDEVGLPRGITDNDDEHDPAELFDIFIKRLNPKDIINSAEGWDSHGIVNWFTEEFYPKTGIQAIETIDGAVVFDPDAIMAVE